MNLRDRSLPSLLAKQRRLPWDIHVSERRGDEGGATRTRAHLDEVRRELQARGRR